MKNPKALFLSHGGGPMPLFGDPGHAEMIATLKTIASSIPKPKALVVVSAHWEAEVPAITANPSPDLIYDYYGFPEESYQIEYPCSGAPQLAQTLYRLLAEAGIKAKLDNNRGLDHGVFVPLKIMYPQADIPCVQLSLVASLDPATHIKMGRALQSLSAQNILLVGSGFSFHNLQAFFTPASEHTRTLNADFEAWLADTCCNAAFTEEERIERFSDWASAPGAQYCHPREEHLLPLFVCYGAAALPCSESYSLNILSKACSMYLW